MKLVTNEAVEMMCEEQTTDPCEQSGVFPAMKLTQVVSPERAADEVLVAQMIANDSRAWRTFDQKYNRLVHRCILKVTRRFTSVVSTEDVREIHAQLMLSLLANDKYKLRTFDPERGNRFSSWIGLLAINCAYDYLRSLKREPSKTQLSEASELVCELPDPFETASDHERAEIAAALLSDFSDRDRAFATLYFGEGMDPVEIAAKLGISVKTVYSKKHKIRTRLESVLAA
ncbi:MAG: sigma-70 family RNA polymerase sigma factor [Polyangiaceae bacterium]